MFSMPRSSSLRFLDDDLDWLGLRRLPLLEGVLLREDEEPVEEEEGGWTPGGGVVRCGKSGWPCFISGWLGYCEEDPREEAAADVSTPARPMPMTLIELKSKPVVLSESLSSFVFIIGSMMLKLSSWAQK